MGCYKTSTGLWFIDKKIKEAQEAGLIEEGKFPSILIITNKSGKGTFFEAVPEIFQGWTFMNIETQAISVFINGKEMKLPGIKNCPKEFGMPTICVTHYNVFSSAGRGQFKEDDNGRPIKDPVTGKFLLKEWKQADYIADHVWDFVWTDEFHRMKDKDSRWTVNIKKIKTRVGRHGSTGTGFINRPNEIWSLLNWLDPKTYTSFWDFHAKYCEIDNGEGYAKVVGVKPENKEEFKALVRNIGVRRTLDQTHPGIEKVVFQPIVVDLNPTQRKMYNEIKGELQTLDQNGTALYSANVLSLLQRLRQICVGTPEVTEDYFDEVLDRRVQKIKLREPSSKLDAVMEVLEGLQWDEERKEPLVVFSCFKDPLDLLKARLNKHNQTAAGTDMEYKYIHMDQHDSDSERYEKWFVEFPKMENRIFMSTLQLGGESINLTPAHHLVFLDRSWSPKDNNQGIGRIRRPGQISVPVVININAKNTVDNYIERVNQVKNGWFREIFHDE
jgi:chromodomain-helicase-DNA-binding protein 7